MKYEEFAEKVTESLMEKLGEGYSIEKKMQVKENDMKKEGIMVRDIFRKSTVFPVLYLEGFYKPDVTESDIQKTVDIIKGMIEKCWEQSDVLGKETGSLKDWGKICTRVYPMLLSQERNRQLLQELVWKPYLDLAICYMVRFFGSRQESCHLKIKPEMLEMWNIDEKDLHEQAMKNLGEDGYSIHSLYSMMQEFLEEGFPDRETEEQEKSSKEMYVLTNSLARYGAAGMLDGRLLEKFAEEKGKNFYILPSSTHEVLLMPDNGKFDRKELGPMIREVNNSIVSKQDILSDTLYYYDIKKRKIEISK